MAKKIIFSKEKTDQIISSYLNDGCSKNDLVKIFGTSIETITKLLKNNNVKLRSQSDIKRTLHNITNMNSNFFDIIDTEEKAYFLGLFFADGNVSKKENACRIKLQERDRGILQTLSYLIYGKDKTKFVNASKYNIDWHKNVQDQYTINIYDEHIKKALISHGCVPAKSLILKFPTHITDPDLIRHFIRGYFDGDGSIYFINENNTYKTRDYTFNITSTLDFCLGVENIIKLYIDSNFYFRYYDVNDKGTKSISTHGARKVEKILNWLYKDANFYLPRKYDIYIDFLLYRYIGHCDGRVFGTSIRKYNSSH